MASRLIEQARDLATYSRQAREDFVRTLLGNVSEGALHRARSLYEQILEVPGVYKSRPFMPFCQSLLGRFPYEAGLTPGFEPVEETVRARLLAQAIEQANRCFLTHPQIYGAER